MFDSVCAFPFTSEVFAQAVHPSEPLISVGLTSGHVSTHHLPPSSSSTPPPRIITTSWRTKRHKASCRCLSYSHDGSTLFSAGNDGIIKAADSAVGTVTGKVAIPLSPTSFVDGPTVLHALSPQTLLVSTDSGALHLYDLRDPAPSLPIEAEGKGSGVLKTAFTGVRPAQTYHPHTDYVSSLTPLPPSATSTSGYSKQFLTTGGTTLALTDLRRGVLAKSEDQEELLLSCLYVTGLQVRKSTGRSGEKAVVGGGDGVITLWEKGQWDDQDERIVVSRDKETLDCLGVVPEGIGGVGGRQIAVGMGDGRVKFVRLGVNKVVGEVVHDEVEGVVALGFDVTGRMITGGGNIVKVWEEHIEAEEAEEQEEEDEKKGEGLGKRVAANSSDDNDDDDDGEGDEDGESSDEEKAPRQRRKKRRKGKGPPGGNAKKFSFAGLD